MMKYFSTLVALLLLLSFGCNQSNNSSDETPKNVPAYTIEQFMGNENIRGGSFSHDESKVAFSSDRTGIFNIYTVPVTGGEATALTESAEDSYYLISYFPKDDRILFSADKGGNEVSHIYLLDENGEMTDLTPAEEAKASFEGWSRDKKSFFFSTNERNPQVFDIYEMDLETMKAKMFFQNDDNYLLGRVSPQKRYIALSKANTSSDNDLYLYDRETKETKHLSPHEGEAASYSAADFTNDESTFYYLSSEGAEFRYLVAYDMETGEKKKELEADWDISYAYNSYNEKYRIVGINEDGKTNVRVTNLATGDKVELPEMPEGEVKAVRISRSETKMGFFFSSSRTPSDFYVYDFESGKMSQLTNTLNPELDPENLVSAEVVRYKSFDGLEIPAILYKSLQASADNKLPALVWVHGGPGGQSRVGYYAFIQYLVNHGYTIMAVNNRGSSGYGKSFYQMDDQNHGDKDLKDCVWGKKYLAEQDYVNPEQIGIIGGSYGGYMTLAALAFQPEEFELGVDIFGVSNWLRTLKSIPPWWGAYRDALYQEMGDPNTADSTRLYEISPLFHAANIKRPLMVLQGANDPRVLKVESDEIVAAVKANDVPVEYVVFEDEGHGFAKKENQMEGYKKVLAFLDEHLK